MIVVYTAGQCKAMDWERLITRLAMAYNGPIQLTDCIWIVPGTFNELYK